MTQPWWKESVIYQIYPRSFCDSNGDGIGDLQGIVSKLDYLKTLGVDVVWLSPIYESPNHDNGYDISDYRAILPEFGTMADFDQLLHEIHARGIRLVMDLVVNHSSDEHRWFRQARQSRDNPYRDYYIWRPPAADGGPPNNWEASFSGSAWTYQASTGEYYLHMFSDKQPDLNWENPRVREEVHGLMRFWLAKGVDGFRMDVINMVSKTYDAEGRLPDAPVVRDGFLQAATSLVANGPRLAEFLQEMKHEVLVHHDIVTVGEAPSISAQQALALTHRDTGALNMVFQFEHMEFDAVPGHAAGKWALAPIDWVSLKASLSRWQEALGDGGWNSLYLANHDQARSVSRFGDDGEHRVASAKMLATLLHGMQGTPYIYQGDELGMTNAGFASIDDCRDIESINMHDDFVARCGWTPEDAMRAIRAKGRDNARTPMQWSRERHAGFSTARPWLPVNANFDHINAADQIDAEDSIFSHYRRLIALRRQHPVLVHGRFRSIPEADPRIFAYLRTQGSTRWLVICNLGKEQPVFRLPADIVSGPARLQLGNYEVSALQDLSSLTLRPYDARMYQLD